MTSSEWTKQPISRYWGHQPFSGRLAQTEAIAFGIGHFLAANEAGNIEYMNAKKKGRPGLLLSNF